MNQHQKQKPREKLAQVSSLVEARGRLVALTLLRVAVGVIMTVHGGMKLGNPQGTISTFSEMGIPFPELSTYLAVAGELAGGLGLLVGLLTRVAAVGPVLTMAAAIGFVHLGNGLLSDNGGWEFPLLLLIASLVFVFEGGGPFSVDALMQQMKSRKRSAQGESSPSEHHRESAPGHA